MKRRGICQKCGKETTVQDHHYKGYGKEYKDEVVPYCQSCDMKAHNKARKKGTCILNTTDRRRKTKGSYRRRSSKKFELTYETIGINMQLVEFVELNLNTGHVGIYSYFRGSNKNKLKIITE